MRFSGSNINYQFAYRAFISSSSAIPIYRRGIGGLLLYSFFARDLHCIWATVTPGLLHGQLGGLQESTPVYGYSWQCVSSEGYSLSVCRTLLFLPFGSCKPSLCSMFSFFYSIKFFERQLWKVCVAFIFPLLVTYFYVPHHEWIIENTEHNHFLHWYFYYIIMLFGAIAAQRRTNTESPSSIARPLSAVLLIVTVYYSLKIYILHSASPIYDVQLCIPILLTLFSIYMFRLFERLSNIGTKKTAAIVNYIASLTLDIYIVQFVIMDYFTRYTFPFGYFGSIAAILLTAGILNYISKYATSFLRNSLSKLII